MKKLLAAVTVLAVSTAQADTIYVIGHTTNAPDADPAAGPTSPPTHNPAGGASSEGPVTIDFEDLGVPPGSILSPPDGECIVSAGHNYCPGPNNDSNFNDLHMGNAATIHAWNGTTQGTTHDDVELSRGDGEPFTLLHFDFAGFPTNAEVPFTVTALPGGPMVAFTPDGIVDGPGGAVDFETFTLPPNFTGTSFYWEHKGVGTIAGLFALDNIMVTSASTACLQVIDDEITCHADGSTFTYTVEGTDVCTGGTNTYSFTASGGAAGEELCFTLLVTDEQGGFCCSTEICVTIPDCSPAAGMILWDDSHDTNSDELSENYSIFAAALTGAGHVIAELDGAPGAITPAALSGFNAFFLMDPELALTGAEITTLQGFVAGGGGLFVAWDGGAETTSLNTLLTPYGLSFSGGNDVPSGTVISNFVSHPVTAGLSSFEFGAGALVGTTGSAIDLIAGADPDILAVSGGTDRIVAIGDASMFKDALIGDLDNELLVINIANYMVAPAALPSDLNGDGVVGMQDFLALLGAWGSCSDCGTCPADFDGDCSVGILDLLILLGNWG